LGHLIDFYKEKFQYGWLQLATFGMRFSKMDHFEILNKIGFLEIFLFSYLFFCALCSVEFVLVNSKFVFLPILEKKPSILMIL